MLDFRADLHCHTIYSDGSFTTREILLLAKQKGLQGLAITDHDSIGAYRDAITEAQEIGIELLTGVEFSAAHHNISIHILGYGFHPFDPTIQRLCDFHKQRREERNAAIIKKLCEHNMALTIEEVNAAASHPATTIGRPHIALAMMRKGYVASIQDAFWEFIGEGRPCFSRGHDVSVADTLDVIHQAKGVAIIAHPHLIKNQGILQELLEMNFEGLEGYYAKQSPQQNARWLKIAEKRNWLITGGSDFHGEMRSGDLGSSYVLEETFRKLQGVYLMNLPIRTSDE